MWRDVFALIFTGAGDRNFDSVRRDLPVNLVGGEKDPATNGGKAVQNLAHRMKRIGFSNLVSTVYPQTRHESLNEVNRDLIMEEFAAWAEAVIQPVSRQ
jgi:alpha-beta hydrolase superfamily lysophospholipase